ncbi:hypothetical protein [Roseibacillus persicicus]|uniref:hypothetical protein n=1 Tax=Roseibacillus persicicus TaxID=454148 RepID=UPI0028104597|nr:hypothetical protein [Roseibacillus persicicus]MDQ8191657.1 hypothetical protein [Roseibacillus persicicus]
MKVFYIFLAWIICLGSGYSQTRAPEDSLLFLAGTTYTEGGDHAWLLWQAQDTSLLQGRSYAIFRKDGPPSSSNSFSQVAIIQPTTRATFLDARLDELPVQFANRGFVSETIDGLFGDLMPALELSLGSKLSALLQTAAQEPELFNRLYFLSRTEPAIAVAMGTGALVPMPATVSTFEVRTQPDGGNSPGAAFTQVVGRITLELNNPTPITAPGPPVVIPDDSPKGHLNVSLRWGIPDDLRRESALTYGYGVYRMAKTTAETLGHDVTPPTPAQLQTYLTSRVPRAVQANMLPVLPTQLLSPSEAAMIPLGGRTDPDFVEPYFFLDDNQAQAEDRAPFADGEQFYYFIATLDLLGRPAAISEGTLVTFCHRHPPLPPLDVSVRNQFNYNSTTGTSNTKLVVNWSPPASIPAPDHYLVYRWESVGQINSAEAGSTGETAHLISTPIPHLDGVTSYQFIDSGSGSPSLPAQAGVTYWYTVKAVLETSCGELPSGHSAPGWGVLRDREGPVKPGGTVTTSQFCPLIKRVGEVEFITLSESQLELFSGTTQNPRYLIFKVTAIDPEIVALSISLVAVSDGVIIGEQNIGQSKISPGNTSFSSYRRVPLDVIANNSLVEVEICAKNSAGKTTCTRFPLAGLNYSPVDFPTASQLCFEVCQEEVISEEDFDITGGGRGTHNPTNPDGSPNPIEFTFAATPETEEYKLYERVDNGPLTMIEQGTVTPGSEVTVADYEHPALASVVCYFLQFFDRHGNPSPMSLVRCLRMSSRVEMPVPLLAQVDHAGDPSNPQGLLRWSCEPNGVERFLIGIGDGLSSIEMEYSPDLTAHEQIVRYFNDFLGSGGIIPIYEQTGDLINGVQHHEFETGRVGGNFGNPALPGQYEILLNLQPGREYHFYVKSLSPAGDVSAASNIVAFTWTESGPPTGPQVPWPARSLPPVDEDFIDGVKAQMIQIDSGFVGPSAMIKIGTVDYVEYSDLEPGRVVADNGPYFTPTKIPDSPSYSYNIYTTPEGESLLPFALYRYQVPNIYFPTVSGDVAQVSPLVEKLRLHEASENNVDYVQIQDPLITIARDPDNAKEVGIYLIDSQGVVEGSNYIYLLVRFKEDGEVDRTIPTNSLFVPFYQD